MIFVAGMLVGLASVVLILEFVIRPTHEQIVGLLTSDRDAAREEAKLYRNILFPVLARTEGAAVSSQPDSAPDGVKTPKPAAPPKPAEPMTADKIFAMRQVPYREKFKMLLRLNDTKRNRVTTLASVLAQPKPVQEKTNGTA